MEPDRRAAESEAVGPCSTLKGVEDRLVGSVFLGSSHRIGNALAAWFTSS